MDFSDRVLEFYRTFKVPAGIPGDIELINPYEDPKRKVIIEQFFTKFFSDENVRIHIFGINPSRINVTASGVNYTDGYALQNFCGIENEFSKTRELTADFFYRVVEQMGGARDFFVRIFPWAMMPVSVLKKKNYANYYGNDVAEHLSGVVLDNLNWASKLPSTGRAVILGRGDNLKYFENLPGSPFGYNDVRVLPHPRWIMQYNRKNLDQYVAEYVKALT